MNSTLKRDVMPFVWLVILTGVAMAGLKVMKGVSTSRLQSSMWVAGEVSEPTLGRLMAGVVFLLLSVALLYNSMKMEKRESEESRLSWICSITGGTLLWIAIGEVSWHFGMPVVSKEGVWKFVNFPRIESVQGVWLFLVMLMVNFLIIRRGSIALTMYLATFLGNWYGHLCMIATYPVARLLGCTLDMQTWNRVAGLFNGTILAIIGIRLMQKDTKYLGTVVLYVAAGTLLYGTILGKV